MKIPVDKKFWFDLIRTMVEKLTLVLLSKAEPVMAKIYWPCLQAKCRLDDLQHVEALPEPATDSIAAETARQLLGLRDGLRGGTA